MTKYQVSADRGVVTASCAIGAAGSIAKVTGTEVVIVAAPALAVIASRASLPASDAGTVAETVSWLLNEPAAVRNAVARAAPSETLFARPPVGVTRSCSTFVVAAFVWNATASTTAWLPATALDICAGVVCDAVSAPSESTSMRRCSSGSVAAPRSWTPASTPS